MKYEVIVDSDLEELEARVTQLIQEGWVCLGGLTVVHRQTEDDKGYDTSSTTYHQAMLKC